MIYWLTNSRKAKIIIMFFLESETIPGFHSFCCVISIHSQTYQGSQASSSHSKKGKWNFHWWCSDGHRYEKEWYDGIVKGVSFKENFVLVEFLHRIGPSVYLHWSAIEDKCWVPVNQVFYLLLISTFNTSGHHYMFLKSELKDMQKQFTENIWTRKQFCALTNFVLHVQTVWSLFLFLQNIWKQLTLIHTKASFFYFVLYTVIPVYFNKFINEIIKWNIANIKSHNYEVLNLQVHLTGLVLTHENM